MCATIIQAIILGVILCTQMFSHKSSRDDESTMIKTVLLEGELKLR